MILRVVWYRNQNDIAMQVPKRKPGKFADEKPDRLITPEKLHSLERALERILEEELPQASRDVAAAKEMGDFSENAAYTEAKSRLRRLQGRAASLKERIGYAEVIERGAAPDGSVRIGASVKVRVNGREKTFEILGSQETDPGAGRISHASPLGALLLGRKAGETVTLSRDGRDITYDIIEVL